MKRWVTFILIGVIAAVARAEAPPDPGRFEKQILVDACEDPLQLEVRGNGDIYFIERTGKFKRREAVTGSVATLASMPVLAEGEVGLIGMALDPAFEENRWVYLLFSREGTPLTMRLARYTLGDASLEPGSERVLLEYRFDKQNNHMSGELEFGPDGCLYIGTGDNTPPIPEFPSDERPGRENFDALRTSGNSMELRGKILRIRPVPAGGYEIPQGNLFVDLKEGRPEVYAMGCRNPYRFSIDSRTGWLYFGDVGPNIEMRFGPNGYDEFNIVKGAGNYGWPLFIGPNEAYRPYDFVAKEVGHPFDVKEPWNRSRNNTGVQRLPPPRPAMLWYPSGSSAEFPELGSGARAAMAGPVFHDDPRYDPKLKLPAYYDGCWFIYDWTRNWIKAVRRDGQGGVAGIEPFLPEMRFRKPIDMKVGPDGTLYLIEYGDKWFENKDSKIVRVVYRRGNRAPVGVAVAEPAMGKHPLTVRFSAHESYDKDGDPLNFRWRFGAGESDSTEANPTFTYREPGVNTAELTTTDVRGESSKSSVVVSVGNAPPRVRLVEPEQGGFFDWGQPIRYRAVVEDEEDGTAITGERVAVRVEYETPRPNMEGGSAPISPGEALMRRSTCFACHARDHAALGPAYIAVAAKYRGDAAARETLANKVLAGGSGVWGPLPMPPHPQHSLAEAKRMVDWVLALGENPLLTVSSGMSGSVVAAKQAPQWSGGGVYVIAATYTDLGSAHAPPLTSRAAVQLHARRKNAVFCDEASGVEVMDVFEGGIRQAGQFSHGSTVAYRQVNLRGITRLKVQYAAPDDRGGRLEVHADEPSGPLIASFDLPPTGEWHHWKQVEAVVKDPGGLHTLFLTAHGASGVGGLFNLDWVEFGGP